MEILYIGIFGACGCLSRYFVSGWGYSIFGRTLPYGTLLVNVLGSFLLGLVMAASMHSTLLPHAVRVGITTGFMGGFTTFSTFSYETFRLIEERSYLQAGTNIVLNLLTCLVFAGLGIALGMHI